MLGYDEVDVRDIEYMRECGWQDTDLTDHSKYFLTNVYYPITPDNLSEVWNCIRPILEPIVQHAKARRLASERAAVIDSRTQILEPLYKLYLKNLLPSQWAFQPSVAEVCEFSPFDTLVQAPNEVVITTASFSEAIMLLPGLISTWIQERRQRLLDMLPASSKVSTNAPSSLPIVSRPSTVTITGLLPARNTASCISTSTIDRLSLAASVFECGNSACRGNFTPWDGWRSKFCNALIAWDGIHTHQCRERGTFFSRKRCSIPSVYEFSPEGSAAAIALISLAGLEVSSATPWDMDQRDLRFFCNTCGPRDHHKTYGRDVYTWRSAVRIVASSSRSSEHVSVLMIPADMPFHSRTRNVRLGCPY
jgi:hypothetical protein